MALRIEDYALLGDTHSAALVGRDGSVDWLCWPRFDSDACFAALLGTPEQGRWQLAPQSGVMATRRAYRPGTMILETDFKDGAGEIRVTDCMPVRDNSPNLVRVVEGVHGYVPVRMDLSPRFGYGDRIPRVRELAGGVEMNAGPDAVTLATSVPLQCQPGGVHAEFTVTPGQRVAFVLTWHRSYEPASAPVAPEEALAKTHSWWTEWSSRCTYQGPWRATVLRSLLTLKASTYCLTGGIVAAATTSLPEQIGGVRNWDYRYCWLRDATLTLFSLMDSGYVDEAVAWRDWLLRAIAGEPSRLQIMYGLGGERRLLESELNWLPGYEGSRPVRIGNGAFTQYQLDVYGEVMDCLHHARLRGMPKDTDTWSMQRALMDFLESNWQRPDEGIWEVRGPRQHFTHSKVMAWVAFDRAIRDAEDVQVDAPLERWRAIRQSIHDEVCSLGFDRQQNSFTQAYRSPILDASLLMIPLVGFLPPTDPRVVGTVAAIQDRLCQGGFVRRYDSQQTEDGLPPGEGVFLACSFWLVDNLALLGRYDEARALFEQLLGLANDVGLLSEQYDPQAKRLVGNFPQAFSHLSLVSSALNLSRPHGPARKRGKL